MEEYFDVARLADECLRLLGLTTEAPRLPTIWYIGFSISINNLKPGKNISEERCMFCEGLINELSLLELIRTN